MRCSRSLIRAKGIIWFAEDRYESSVETIMWTFKYPLCSMLYKQHCSMTISISYYSHNLLIHLVKISENCWAMHAWLSSSNSEWHTVVHHRENRFVFQWSGLKRVEAVSGQPWESSPKSRVVLIGTDNSELQSIVLQLSASANCQRGVSSEPGTVREHSRSFSMMVASDSRFKVFK